jgi:hypothetical protein
MGFVLESDDDQVSFKDVTYDTVFLNATGG